MSRIALATAVLAAGLAATPLARASDLPTIAAAAQAEPRLRTLVQLLERAGLVETLAGPGPFTVFAPTNEAFARVPKETLGRLLQDGRADELRSVLTFHVVAGRLQASDLLPSARRASLQGAPLTFGLKVGPANVVQADVTCANGVVHLIDAVLLPPPPPASPSDGDVLSAIHDAIERGAPVYNAGDHEGCAGIYAAAARGLLRGRVGDLHRRALEQALRAGGSAGERAWALRRAFDRILEDVAFEPVVEAPLPQGFPGPGPVGRVIVKEYPGYRAARSEGGGAFWQLFQHIKKHDIAMTAPVEMTMDGAMRMTEMAFLYEQPGQGTSGADGRVRVLDLPALTVLSIGMRGPTSDDAVAEAKAAVEARAAADGWSRAGEWRMLGYNSPFVAQGRKFWEIQLPVVRDAD